MAKKQKYISKRPDVIRRAMARGRRSWEHYLGLQQNAIRQIFNDVISQVGNVMSKSEQAGKIPPHRTKPIADLVKKQEPILRRRLSSSIKRGMSNSVDHAIKSSILSMSAGGVTGNIQVGSSFIGADRTIRRFNIAKEKYLESAWQKMNQRAMKKALDFTTDGLKLSDRVWMITNTTKKEMLKAVHQGVTMGRSAAAISRDIRYMLRMPETLRGKAKILYQPGQGVYKSAYKNAMRLARTELNQAFWEGTRQYADSKQWIDGYIWQVGNVDACPLCLPHDGEFFPKDEKPQQPHPQCMCHILPHIKEDPIPTEKERQDRISQLANQSKKAG